MQWAAGHSVHQGAVVGVVVVVGVVEGSEVGVMVAVGWGVKVLVAGGGVWVVVAAMISIFR
jgi:hypothetical protein